MKTNVFPVPNYTPGHDRNTHTKQTRISVYGAGDGNRTHVTSLGSWGNSRYTTPAAPTDYGITGGSI